MAATNFNDSFIRNLQEKRAKLVKFILDPWKRDLGELSFFSGFTTFFVSLSVAAIAPYALVIMGVLIGVETYFLARNSILLALGIDEEKSLIESTPYEIFKRVAFIGVEIVVSIAALSAMVAGVVMGVGVMATATPFIFMGITAYRAAQSFSAFGSEISAWWKTRKFINAEYEEERGIFYKIGTAVSKFFSRKDGYAELHGAKTPEEKVKEQFTLLVGQDLANAYFELKQHWNNTLVDSSASLLSSLTDKKFQRAIYACLVTENLPAKELATKRLSEVQKLLAEKINGLSMKQYKQNVLALDGNGFNSTFFYNKDAVKTALKTARKNHAWNAGGYFAMGVVFLTAGTAIAAALSGIQAALTKYAAPLVIAATAGVGIKTVVSAANLAIKASKVSEVELLPLSDESEQNDDRALLLANDAAQFQQTKDVISTSKGERRSPESSTGDWKGTSDVPSVSDADLSAKIGTFGREKLGKDSSVVAAATVAMSLGGGSSNE